MAHSCVFFTARLPTLILHPGIECRIPFLPTMLCVRAILLISPCCLGVLFHSLHWVAASVFSCLPRTLQIVKHRVCGRHLPRVFQFIYVRCMFTQIPQGVKHLICVCCIAIADISSRDVTYFMLALCLSQILHSVPKPKLFSFYLVCLDVRFLCLCVLCSFSRDTFTFLLLAVPTSYFYQLEFRLMMR